MTSLSASLSRTGHARFERIRCAIARHIFARKLYGFRICLVLVPKDHPWSVLVRSAYRDVNELTEATLWPRDPKTGTPDPKRHLRHGRTMWRSFVTTAIIAYLVLDSISTRVPGPMSHFSLDDQVRIFDRFREAISAFLGA